MASLADSLVSSAARRLPIRKRPDLSARRQTYLGRSYWVVKEPIGLKYYRFQEEEFAILNMLDGDVSLDDIKQRFEADFPPQKITLEELQQFLGMLHRSGLVIASVPNQGRQLHKRRDDRQRKEFLGAISNILCIRFKGFDPERLLNWLHPKTSWLFSRAAFVLSILFILSALTLVIVQFDVFRSRLPGFYQFFSPSNALLLALTLGLTKVFHEFGHGLVCKHFGGECHEMGVMILVLTPCLYCNVSDSWMLPSKWQRAAIGAAGMYVEVVLASLATFVWWFSEPGLLNYLALNVMFIASVTTLLFNANPLLRYDGYYILADLMEIPNLRQKATSILGRKMGQLLLGIEPPEDPFLPQRNQVLFALYSIAAAVYRWFVMASILWFLYQVFKPYKLQVIGQMIVAMSLYGLIVMPLYKLVKFFYVPGRIDKVKKPRMVASIVVIAALLAAVVLVPLPNRILCPLEIQARDARPVYVDVEGRLEQIDVAPGDRVEAGQQIALLVNPEVDLEIVRLRGEVERYETQLRNLRRLGFRDRDAAST
ncbi:MAG: hemolysin D, partial [Patescibacteria group bacterium]|nr:hemolysin D [Patescibacteria group bacterium]